MRDVVDASKALSRPDCFPYLQLEICKAAGNGRAHGQCIDAGIDQLQAIFQPGYRLGNLSDGVAPGCLFAFPSGVFAGERMALPRQLVAYFFQRRTRHE
ncbi:MAG: hypothetical protein RSE46_18465, partial [Janthinobacterium sp.]